MKFTDTRFWKHYSEYRKNPSVTTSSRCAIDALILWKLLINFQFRSAVEVGTFQGLTSGLILESIPECTLLGIDPCDQMALFQKHYPDFQDRFSFLNLPIQDVNLHGKEFDFVLMDSLWGYTTTLPEIVIDTEKFLPHLTQSGVIAFSYVSLPKSAIAFQELHARRTGWVPFLRSPQIEFWHHESSDRNEFLDSLLADPINKFMFIYNEVNEFGHTICVAKSISMLTDYTEFADLAFKHYNI